MIQGILQGLDQKKNILVEAPTGSGKTVSLLTSILGWAYENFMNSIKNNGDI